MGEENQSRLYFTASFLFDQDLAAPRLLDLLGHPARREGSYQVLLAFFKEKSLI
jgi:hypothetical protein